MTDKSDETRVTRRNLILGAGAAVAVAGAARSARAKSAEEIDVEVEVAVQELFATVRGARTLFERSSGVLIIPDVIKAGFVIAGAYGEGALLIGGITDSYWSYASGSFGFQAGAQSTSQALFFLTPEALRAFVNSSIEGFEVGVDAEVTVIESGAELSVDTTEDPRPIIGVVYGRTGLLGGASLQGGKYSEIER